MIKTLRELVPWSIRRSHLIFQIVIRNMKERQKLQGTHIENQILPACIPAKHTLILIETLHL